MKEMTFIRSNNKFIRSPWQHFDMNICSRKISSSGKLNNGGRAVEVFNYGIWLVHTFVCVAKDQCLP